MTSAALPFHNKRKADEDDDFDTTVTKKATSQAASATAQAQHGTNRGPTIVVSVTNTLQAARNARMLGGDTYGLATLEGLPTHVLRPILLQLPIFDYLAVKFVSRTIYNATMVNGLDIVADKKDRIIYCILGLKPDVWVYNDEFLDSVTARAMLGPPFVALENRVLQHKRPWEIKLLTCALCAKLKDQGLNGFLPEQFDKNNDKRHCLECTMYCIRDCCAGWRLSSFEFEGKHYFKCTSCTKIFSTDDHHGGPQGMITIGSATRRKAVIELAECYLCEDCAGHCLYLHYNGTLETTPFY